MSVVNYNAIYLNHHNIVNIKCQLTYLHLINDPQGGEVSERGKSGVRGGGVSGGGVGRDFYRRPKIGAN